MMWPEEGNIIDAASKWIKWLIVTSKMGNLNGSGRKRVIQRIWPEEENLTDMDRRRDIKLIWPEEGNITDVDRRG